MSRANEPAYPMLEPGSIEGMYGLQFRGLTIREAFVMAAMQGEILAGRISGDHFRMIAAMAEAECCTIAEIVAREAIVQADATLAALEKGDGA